MNDLEKSKAFFGALGFSFNPQFTNADAACMVISDDIFSMLLTKPFFRQFTDKTIADATSTAEVLVALSTESKDKVNAMVDAALAAGGTETQPPQNHGFMCGRSFNDLDGHIWEIFWMDPAHVQG